jgi:leucoanthocyanidin reductase
MQCNADDSLLTAFFVAGADIGKFTVKAAYDARSMNKVVHFRPACNLLSTNEMACLWESKIGRTLPRVTLSKEDLLAMAAGLNTFCPKHLNISCNVLLHHDHGSTASYQFAEDIIPASIVASLTHDIFINGCQTNYGIDGLRDVEISSLYPDMPFRTIDECFDDYVRALDLEEEEATENKKSNPPMVEILAVHPMCA